MTVALSEGTVFAGRYRVLRRIAMGGMGAVYEVMHLETERRLALKVMLPHIVQSAEMRERFRREARVAAQVESEHIVDVHDAGIDEATESPYLVMELLRGEEVAKALRRLGRFGAVETVNVLHQAALALDKTHRASIVHRDLKPENLFLTEREDGQLRVKVLDFGIAKLIAEGSTQDPGTRSLGTPLYMAPEQFRAGLPVSPLTDVYALGMIAYTMLVGTSYWAEEAKDSSNVFMFAGAVMQGPREPASVRARRHGVPIMPTFDPWFAQATAAQAQARWPGAVAAVAALADALGVPRPGGLNLSSSGPLRSTGSSLSAPLPPQAGSAITGQGTVTLDEASTLLYSGSQPRLGISGPHATGPQSAGQPVIAAPGTSSATGGAYGSATGVSPSAPSSNRRMVFAAVGAGLLIGGIGLAAMFLLPAGSPGVSAGGAASAGAPPIVSAPPASATASADPVVEPAPSPSASAPSAEPRAAASAPAAPPRGRTQRPAPPAPSAKKTIYVRD